MSFIRKLFAPKVKNSRPNYSFERDTTKLVGKPLSVVYGDRVHVFGNVVCRKMSSDLKQTRQGVALCWGPVTIHTETIRVNEKRPEYINGVLNAQRNLEPGFISGLKVWAHAGNLGQAPAHGLIYGLNRTAYIWVEATANDDISGVDTVECDITRGNLFSSVSPEDEYNTPIPAEIAAAFPSGVRSSNPVAAALDYILNKDYGAGRDLTSFNGFASWVSAINQCDTVLNVASSVGLGWAYGLRTDFLENGWYVEKLPAPDNQPTGYPGFAGPIAGTGSYDWNGIAISRSYRDLADGDFAVTAEAQPFSLMTLADENTQCTEEIGMDNPVTCTTTYEAQTYNKSVLFGLAKASTGNYVSDFLYAIHLTGDGLVEVWEDGVFETFNGGYAAGDTLTIDVTGTTVTYKKNGTAFKVSTRAVAPADYPLYLQTAIYQPGASIRFTEWTGVEGEYRYSASGEFGKGENDKHIDIINRLLDIANASVYEKDGIKCWIAKATAAVASLDRSTFDPKGVDTADIMDIPNVVEVIYGSEDEDGERLSAIWEDPDVIAAWKETRETIDEEAIRTRTQASRKAAFIGRRAKAERKMVKGTADQRFMTLEPGDVVNVTMGTATTSWFTAKPFWVEEIVPENREGDVELTLTEY
ncbi:MAG: phage tail protein, partial [Alphaproteobacteria bacterium]|nr:phage tail protein [Alphaproteobacteria bacterium]